LAFDGGAVRLWQFGDLDLPLPDAGPDSSPPESPASFAVVAYSPDRKTVFVGGAGPNGDDYGRLVEIASDRPLGSPLNRGAGEPWRHDSGLVPRLIVDGPTFSPDGTLLATCIRPAGEGRD